MTFAEAIRSCFNKYITFSGRSRRSEFWWFFLFVVLVELLAALLDGMLFEPNPVTQNPPQPISLIVGLALYIPLLAVTFRRLHDCGRPGWYALIPMLISLATFIGMMTGVLIFAKLASAAPDPEIYRSPAAFLGGTGLIIALIAQIAVTILMIFWLTRPSDAGFNAYGAPQR